MTTLAPRRRPLFYRRGDGRQTKLMGIAAAALVVACIAFSVGIKVGAQADSPRPDTTALAANWH